MEHNFVKINYSEKSANEEILRLENKFANLKNGYDLISVTCCRTNGRSCYVTINKTGEINNFVFRISDHRNGNSNKLITENTLTVECNSENVNDMYRYYNDCEITADQDRLIFLKNALKEYEMLPQNQLTIDRKKRIIIICRDLKKQIDAIESKNLK